MKRGLLLPWLLFGSAAHAAEVPPDSLLSAPGDYSLAPPPLVAGGVATTSFGSGGMRSSSVQLESGPIGGNTRAFVSVGAGQGPQFHGRPSINGSSFAGGVTTELPYGTTLSIGAGFERDRISGRGFPAYGPEPVP